MSQPPPPATGEPGPDAPPPPPEQGTPEPPPEQTPPERAASEQPPRKQSDNPLRSSRTSGAWTGVVVAIVLIVLLVIFVVQNTESTPIEFLWLDGSAPTAVLLLIAAAAGMAIAALVGSLRIMQLRRRVKRGR